MEKENYFMKIIIIANSILTGGVRAYIWYKRIQKELSNI